MATGEEEIELDPIGEDDYGNDGYDDQSKGEHRPLLSRTSTSKSRETQRPFMPRKRTSTRKDEGVSNPSYVIGDDEMETSFGGGELLHSSKDPRVKFNDELRVDVKKLFPRMTNSVQVDQIDGRLSVRLFGDEKWSFVYNKNGKISLQFNKDLKKALGFKREDIIKTNDEQNSTDQVRIDELEKNLEREDISEEVRNTTINEINELKEGIVERNQENEIIVTRSNQRNL